MKYGDYNHIYINSTFKSEAAGFFNYTLDEKMIEKLTALGSGFVTVSDENDNVVIDFAMFTFINNNGIIIGMKENRIVFGSINDGKISFTKGQYSNIFNS